jgi:hypothetical protein
MEKKGSINLSINAILVIILAIVVLGLGMFFIKGMVGKTTIKADELLDREPEPHMPTGEDPISLSRGKIVTNSGGTEVIKIKVLNPTGSDWIERKRLYHGLIDSYVCGESDHVCYIDNANGCDGSSDPDCNLIADKNICNKDDICLVNKLSCPEFYDTALGSPQRDSVKLGEYDPGNLMGSDCGSHPGIDLLIRCDNKLKINKLSEPKIIPSTEIEEFTLVLGITEVVKGNYLCKVKVFGNDEHGKWIEGFEKDINIEVE